MKKLFLIFITSWSVTFSQSQTYFDAPFGGGGGFIPGFQFVNMNDLNDKLTSLSLPKFDNGSIFTTGGGGFIYIGFVPQLRVGGIGYGGTKSITYSNNNVSHQVDYNLGVGGFTIEYTLPFVKDIAISVGAVLGGGEISVDFYENSENFVWQSLLTSGQKNKFTKIKNDFFIISPTFNLDIPIYRFIALRFGVGYQQTLGGKWKANNDQTLFNMPSSFNGNSFFINTGIYFGFFAF
jgi:hypothetical protein